MADKNSLTFKIKHTINDIPESAWRDLFDKGIVENYGYHKTLEESGLKEFSFAYLTAERANKLCAIVPFFIMDFSFDTLLPDHFKKIAKRLKPYIKMKVLFLGAPTTEEFYFGLSSEENIEPFFNQAIQELHSFCKEKNVCGLNFYNISDKNAALRRYLQKNGFIEMESLPTTMIEIKASSLDDYIRGLSKNMQKDIRRKINRSQSQVQLTTETRDNIDDISQEIYRLYLNNFSDSEVRFEVLTEDFFRRICRNMPNEAKYFITYAGTKIVAFNLFMAKDGLFIDKFIGFDEETRIKYHLYFTTFCHNIDWCIKNGCNFYQPGTTDYHPKLRLGAKLIPLYNQAKGFNPLLHNFLKLISRFIQPINLDPSLKELRKP